MGSSESRPGYRIIEIMKNSPADGHGLSEFIDFITSINGTNILESSMLFQDLIKSNIDCPVTLGIFSIKDMTTREVQITPKNWEGDGLLGLSLRYEDTQEALQSITRVTKVFKNSPASTAGLIEGEFIIGIKECKFRNCEDISAGLDRLKTITLAVFNKSDQSVHFISLSSTDGSIGIEVANGVLHRLNDG